MNKYSIYYLCDMSNTLNIKVAITNQKVAPYKHNIAGADAHFWPQW